MDLSGAKPKKPLKKKTSTVISNKEQNQTVEHHININISVPTSLSLKKIIFGLKAKTAKLLDLTQQINLPKLPYKKMANITLLSVIAICTFFVFKSYFSSNSSNNYSDEVKGIEAEKKEKPDFKVYYPVKNKKEEMSYDYKKKVASYPDQIDTIPITISQQKLPDPFKANPVVELEKLAKQINANTKLETTSVNAFMGQSVKGPQTVVFVKEETLIFIKSDSQVAISDWNKYLDSLALQN